MFSVFKSSVYGAWWGEMESLIDLERSRPAKASVKSCIFFMQELAKNSVVL